MTWLLAYALSRLGFSLEPSLAVRYLNDSRMRQRVFEGLVVFL